MYLYDEVDHRHMTRAIKLTLKAVYFLGPQWRALAPQAEPSSLTALGAHVKLTPFL